MATAPSSENYTIGMCTLTFQRLTSSRSPDGDQINLGNIVTAELAPAVTYLDHHTVNNGEMIRDKTVATLRSISIPFTWDEVNIENLRWFLLGGSGTTSFSVLTQPIIEGSATLDFDTNVGNSFNWTIPLCAIRPNGNLGFNAEAWMQAGGVLEVLRDDYTSTSASAPFGTLSMS